MGGDSPVSPVTEAWTSNLAVTNVASGGTDAPSGGTQETWTVMSSSGFPSAGAAPPVQFHVADPVASSEIIAVTNVSGTTWTVTRGAESTTPVTHSAGFTVYQVTTAGGLTSLSYYRTDWLNVVTQYGADPTGANDSTTIIQDVLSGFPSTGGVAYLPGGTYKISSELTIPSYVTLLGAGTGATVISQTAANTHGLYSVDTNGISAQNLTVAGPGDSAGTGDGVYVAISENSASASNSFSNLLIKNFGNDAFYGNGLITSSFQNVEVESCAENGFDLVDCTSLAMAGCYARSVSGYGYFLDGLAYTALSGCASDGGSIGYFLEGCLGVGMTACGAESQTGAAGYKISGASTNITLSSCYNRVNPGVAFLVTGSSLNVVLIACMERSPGAGATASFETDSGSTAVVIAPTYVTATDFASGTTNLISAG